MTHHMKFQSLFHSAWVTIGQVVYGMGMYEIERAHRRARGGLEHLFILITFGDLVGLPILPPYYSMRLLPFVVPEIRGWQHRMARERDYLDTIF
jgi:hypothetical protein